MKIFRTLLKKLRSGAGETLTETLVSVLIVSLVSTAFVAMISTSKKINETAKEYDKALDEAERQITAAGGSTTEVKATFIISQGTSQTFDVEIHKQEESVSGNNKVKIYSYEYTVPGSESDT